MAVATKKTQSAQDSAKKELAAVLQPIAGNAAGKNLLSMTQLNAKDIQDYIDEAYAAEALVHDPAKRGLNLLPNSVLKIVMRQPSTRTGGSMATAMAKLGGSAEVISGMSSSSEAKGETLPDSWVAFATQADILGIRTTEDGGPVLAAQTIATAARDGKLWQKVPVINLGDGRNEHPTQALFDLFTIHKKFGKFKGLTIVLVGDHERYRPHHSLMLGAAQLGMNIVAVESPVAKAPKELVKVLGDKFSSTDDLDAAMQSADVLYMGRNPDEYSGDDKNEQFRAEQLAASYAKWIVDYQRLQQMKPDAMVMHPRPRRNELHPSIDADPRAYDVIQMANAIPMRMAIIARHLGVSISNTPKQSGAKQTRDFVLGLGYV